jgi:copper transporter 1
MIFTWDWRNVCVVFKWWHIRTFSDFLISFIAIVLLTAFYEYIKDVVESWELNYSPSLTSNIGSVQVNRFKIKRALVYGLQVFFSFWLMLVFMTYNGWLMIAVALGAIIGNYLWGNSANRSLACH